MKEFGLVAPVTNLLLQLVGAIGQRVGSGGCLSKIRNGLMMEINNDEEQSGIFYCFILNYKVLCCQNSLDLELYNL